MTLKGKKGTILRTTRVTPQLKIACLYLAIGYSDEKTAEILGVTTRFIRERTRLPKFRKIIERHQAKLARALIKVAVVAAYSDLTHSGRVMVPLPPKPLTAKKFKKARVKKKPKPKKKMKPGPKPKPPPVRTEIPQGSVMLAMQKQKERVKK